ncbi:uncharacterized protein LOC120822346 isoform X2 [Gasterosteus aculeatus]
MQRFRRPRMTSRREGRVSRPQTAGVAPASSPGVTCDVRSLTREQVAPRNARGPSVCRRLQALTSSQPRTRMSNQKIVDDIHRGNSEPYGAEPLRDLLKLLPEEEEVKKLKSYRGDISKLSLADSFVHLLLQLPSYCVCIEAMLLKEEFPAASEVISRDIAVLRSATKELMCCEELHAVLHLVLQAGNLLNAGGYAGNAVGFKLSSLLSLADTKANKPGMNLLHFVALEAQKKDTKLLEFPLKLTHVQPASRVSLETLDAELQWQTSRARSVEENVRREAELLQRLGGFLQSASSSLSSLHAARQQLKEEGSELIDFFCEDRETFKLDDCFSIFSRFCCRFTAAATENAEREAKEAARRRRQQELEEQKRHSWAGSEEVGGAAGLRCRSEADVSAAMSALLSPKFGPRSDFRSSQNPRGSWRRSRVAPEVAAERELSSLLGSAAVDARRAFLPVAPPPRVTTCSFPRQPSAIHATASYLSDAASSGRTAANCTGGEEGGVGAGLKPDFGRANEAGQDFGEHLSVVLETCSLVPPPEALGGGAGRRREEQPAEEAQGEEEEGREEKAVVWCVCEAAGEVAPGAAPANRTPSEPPPANDKPAPEPISSQPVPVPRPGNPSRPASSPMWRPPPLSASSSKREAESANPSRSSARSLPTPRTRPAGTKDAVAPGNKNPPVRILTVTESQSMRRVVSISRTSRLPGEPSGRQRALPRPSAPDPSGNAAASRPPRHRADQEVPTAREQKQEAQRRPSIRKPSARPRPQPEEKLCRSTLRSLSGGVGGVGGVGGGGSVSAPVTPLHKATTPSAMLLPSFARSTASSSFRRTNTTLTPPPPPPRSPHTGSSTKSSPKNSSSSSSSSSTPFTRAGSLRVSNPLKPPSSPSSSSSTSRRSNSISAPPRSPLHDPLPPPKGHRRSDSSAFSDKSSSHPRDSGKSSRPGWR